MKWQDRTYTREFKLETLRLDETSGKSASQVERDLGISRASMYRWKKAFADEGEQAFPGRGRLTPQQEQIRQLKRENEILRQQRDIPEKTTCTACGASECPSSRIQTGENPIR